MKLHRLLCRFGMHAYFMVEWFNVPPARQRPGQGVMLKRCGCCGKRTTAHYP